LSCTSRSLPAAITASTVFLQVQGVDGDDRRRSGQGRRVGAEMRGDLARIQPLQGIADRTIGRRAPPPATERFVEPRLVRPDEWMDAPVRGRAAHDGQDAEQEQVRPIEQSPLGATGVQDRQ
jgi:hypothetical protein